MATPVGHYLLGLSIAALAARDPAERRAVPWWALMACAPDLDVLPGAAIGDLSRFHHGASHSLAAAGAVALGTAALYASWRGHWSPRVPMLVFALYLSHGALDSVTLDDGWPFGIPLLWPWSDATYQAPWVLLPNVQHTRAPLVSLHNALLAVREAVIFAPLVGLVLAVRAGTWRWRIAVASACAAWFATAAGLSFASLR
jgi:membrane-bound metal-dependent hydrolase YbcI (DUF457 family)